MKKLLFLFVLAACSCFCVPVDAGVTMTPRKTSSRDERAYAMAAKCYGNIRVVSSGADFKVRIVDAWAHLNVSVQSVPGFASVGNWHFVDCFEDYTVEFVDSGEDFTIQFSSFGGLNR